MTLEIPKNYFKNLEYLKEEVLKKFIVKGDEFLKGAPRKFKIVVRVVEL